MQENERFKELIDEIKSLPTPSINNKNQKLMHDHLMNIAGKNENNKPKQILRKKITTGIAGITTLLLFTIIILSLTDQEMNNASDTDSNAREGNEEVVNEYEEQETIVDFKEEQYQEIVEIYQNYEPPMEGEEVDYIDEEYGVIYYNNGISIVQDTKSIAHWPVDKEGESINPTSDQTLAAIKGDIEELKDKPIGTKEPFGIDYPNDINHKLDVLNRLKNYNHPYEPIMNWMTSTIGYFEKAKHLLNDEREEAILFYENGMNNISKFVSALEPGAGP